MDKLKYDGLIDEVFGLIDKKRLSEVIKSKRSAIRVDGVQDLIRTAIMESSVSKYKGFPYFFGGRIYEKMTYDDFSNLVYDLMKKSGLPLGDYARVKSVTDLCLKAISNKELVVDRELMVFDNGVLDTRTKELHKFGKEYVQTSCVGYSYDKMAIAPQWSVFLDTLLPDRRDRRILQEALGCLLINREGDRLDHIVFMSGRGVNAKEIVLEAILGVFGRDGIGDVPISSLLNGVDKKKNIGLIEGFRANLSNDFVGMMKNEDQLRSIVCSEPIEAREAFGESFIAKDIPIQFVTVNDIPETKQMSDALHKHIVVVDFKKDIPMERFSKRAYGIFKDEYCGIFNWILEGKDRFVKNKYEFSDRSYIDTKVDEFIGLGNSVLKFMHSNRYYRTNKSVTDTIPRWVYSSNLYAAYKKWCLDNELPPETLYNFGAILSKEGYKKRSGSRGNQYAIFGTTIINDVKTETVVERAKRPDEDNVKPYMMDGREYINTQAGISKQVGVSSGEISILRKAGLLTDCYHMDGRVIVFDIEKTKMRLKQIGKYMTEEQAEAIKKKMKDEAKKRALFNADMKKNNSKERLYKSPEDEILIKLRNSIQREERRILSQEVKKLEKKYDKLTKAKK